MTYRVPLQGVPQITNYLVKNFNFEDVLDIGCGYAPYAHLFLQNKIKYTGIDYNIDNTDKENKMCIKDDFMIYDFENKKFDCVYTSHCIEHIADTEMFLRRIKHLVKDDGIMCIIFPKPKSEVVGGHVHIFNPGILLYNMVRIGIDCRNVHCLDCEYSYAIIGKIKKVEERSLIYDNGDIEILSDLFPFNAKQNFHGVNGVNLRRL